MLILSRRIGQQIIINGNIKIKIRNFDDETATLAIDAPEYISVADIKIDIPPERQKYYNKPTKQPVITYKRKKILQK